MPRMKQAPKICLILDNVRSAHNVGSALRTADAVGVERIYLCGVTPLPIDRFGRPRADIAKVALGAERSVLWEHAPDCIALLLKLKRRHYNVLALEQHSRSVDYRAARFKGVVALVVGNEPDGLPAEILAVADTIIEIPMRGDKESLNVSVALGVALYELTRQYM